MNISFPFLYGCVCLCVANWECVISERSPAAPPSNGRNKPKIENLATVRPLRLRLSLSSLKRRSMRMKLWCSVSIELKHIRCLHFVKLRRNHFMVGRQAPSVVFACLSPLHSLPPTPNSLFLILIYLKFRISEKLNSSTDSKKQREFFYNSFTAAGRDKN